jgi:hypothetical protein
VKNTLLLTSLMINSVIRSNLELAATDLISPRPACSLAPPLAPPSQPRGLAGRGEEEERKGEVGGGGRMAMSRSILSIIRDDIWEFVSAVVGIIAILVAYNIFFLQREVKSLQIVILANSSLVQVEPSIAQDIKIFYKGFPTANLSLVQVKVENNGNQAIRGEDYEQPVSVTFPSQAKIVEATVVESDPPNIGLGIVVEGNVVTLSPVLLNAGDRVILRVLLIDMPPSINAEPFQIAGGRIAGVKDIPVVRAITETQGKESGSFWSALIYVSLGVGISMLLGVLARAMIWALGKFINRRGHIFSSKKNST